MYSRDQFGRDRVGHGIGRLEIKSEHLLRMPMLSQSDEASLDRGRTFRIDHETRDVTAFACEHVGEQNSLGIVSHDTEAVHLRTERGEASGHVSRTTGRTRDITMRCRTKNRNGSFRTQALSRPSNLLIQHEVADQDDFERFEPLKRFQKSDELVRFGAHA